METLVDRLNQANSAGQRMEHPNAAAADGARFVGDFVVNVAGGELRLKRNGIARFIKATANPILAFGEPVADNAIHLKSFRGRCAC
jgi:hypothetical protein